jgi:hypothetical protein
MDYFLFHTGNYDVRRKVHTQYTIRGKKRRSGAMSKRTSWCLSLFVTLASGVALGMILGERSIPAPAMAQEAPSKTVRAEKFELVDHNNNVRGVLDMGAGDEANLQLLDSKGIPRVRIAVAADGAPLMTVNGPKGKARAGLYAPASGPGGLAFFNEQGKVVKEVTGPAATP